eukprot:8372387-Ditylum_brightwellii.AAC.2
MAPSMVHAILPAGTEVSAADHDCYACLKIIPLATAVFNIGEELSESLLSVSPDGQSRAFFSLHCALFAKSNCFDHITVSLYILHSERIKKLVARKKLPDTLLHTSYQLLSDTEQRDVDDAMSYIHWFEVDCGGDCNFNHFPNFCVHLAFSILLKVDKLMM